MLKRFLGLLLAAGLMAQAPVLNIVVVEGEGAINNIKQRTAREPVVEVQDENHRPVAGAAVVFSLPTQGAGGTFAGGVHSLTVITDAQGRAVAHGFRPNGVKGQFQIHVNASLNGSTGSTNISQSNAAGAGGAAAAGGISTKLIVILAVAAAAAAAGGLYAAYGGGGSSPTVTTPTATTISPGTGTVGAPAIVFRGRR
ncbi:MAG TPA: hypothetical protein VME43_31280 [Bryobacteraceae bacterium]|nr:hypothetical protein [Bryobacteraceae bacterium]